METESHSDPRPPSSRGRARRSRRSASPLAAATASLLALWLAGPLAGGPGDHQTVTPTPLTQSQTRNANEAVSVTFQYNSSSPNTTGLGVRIHFESSKLTYQGVSGVFSEGGSSLFMMGPSGVENDTSNQDGNAATDKVVLLAWANTMATFTGGALPVDLFTANFVTTPGFSGTTNVNLTAVDTAVGFSFVSSPATIAHPSAATPTPTPTPTPGPTATPTPTPPLDTAVLDVDGNGIVHALSDGMLILRWMFELRGNDLIANAVAGNCERCTIEEIEQYLTQHNDALDIDDNDLVHALSDGMLILRWMFELRGNDLVANAVAGNCKRCTIEEIEQYLEDLSN